MVTPSIGSVVTVPFPFSDLSDPKLRPTLVLAEAGHGDWILCQITSNAYSDPLAVRGEDDDFSKSSLDRTSYARPSKIFWRFKCWKCKNAKSARKNKNTCYRRQPRDRRAYVPHITDGGI